MHGLVLEQGSNILYVNNSSQYNTLRCPVALEDSIREGNLQYNGKGIIYQYSTQKKEKPTKTMN
jgi:hypothetical protein